jgi:cytochrome c oxidase cbb3-type subunit III
LRSLIIRVNRQIIYLVAAEIFLGCLAVQFKAETPPPAANGRALYSSRCAGCHGLDGKGGEHGPNIATTPDVQHLADADIQRIVREGIPAAGMPPFGSEFSPAQIAAVVEHLRLLQGRHKQVPVTGDVQRGKQLFFGRAKCSECHMLAGQGGFLGSDLSGYGGSHSAADISDAILDPNKNLDPRNQLVIAVTRDNHTYSGILRNEDNFSIQLQSSDGSFHFFDKSSLAHIKYTRRSMMPSDYGATLSRTELDDLIAYLLTSASQQSADQPQEPADH